MRSDDCPDRRRVPKPAEGECRVPSASTVVALLGDSITTEESNEIGSDGVDDASAVVEAFATSFAVRAVRAASSIEASGLDLSPAGVKSCRSLSLVPRICSALLWDGPGLRGGER
jgi:hypothetical protein